MSAVVFGYEGFHCINQINSDIERGASCMPLRPICRFALENVVLGADASYGYPANNRRLFWLNKGWLLVATYLQLYSDKINVA